MAISLGGFGAGMLQLLSSTLTWALVLLGIIVVTFIALKLKQNRKFKYPCLEIVGLGQGKCAFYTSKAGWFKKNRKFFGLVEMGGEQELVCKDQKRKIHNISSTDYHEFNGKRCVVCKRKDDDPDILVPLNKVEIRNLNLLASIAPADYRDAGIQIMEEKKRETMTWLEKNGALVMAIGIFIFGIIALVIVFNFAKGESTAWRDFAEASKTAGTVILNSSAP